MIDGYVIDSVVSPRDALTLLAGLLMFEAVESGEAMHFVRRGRKALATFTKDDVVEDDNNPLTSVQRAQETELPAEIAVGFSDTLADFRPTSANARRLVTGSRRTDSSDTNATISYAIASGLADAMLQDLWAGRETWTLALGGRQIALEAADICDLVTDDGTETVLVTRIEDGAVRRIEARSIDPEILTPTPGVSRALPPATTTHPSAPDILLLDLPLITGDEPGYAPRIAAFASPWPGAIAVAVGTPDTGYPARQVLRRRAVTGELTAALTGGGPLGRWDAAESITVRLYGGALAGAPELAVLNGADIAAIGTGETGFEVVQFETATLVGSSTWRLDGLLRGQGGTIDIAAGGHAVGARFVLLDGAAEVLDISAAEAGLSLTLRCGPAGAVYDPEIFVDVPLTAARRGLKCLAPVHLTAERDPGSGDVTIAWIRQSRIGADAWEPVEIPLGETSETYEVAVLDGSTTLRTLAATSPSAVYSAADQIADFGSPPSIIAVRVSQVSPTEGPGVAAESELHV